MPPPIRVRRRNRPMIDIHYWPTPNGKKVTILLEECALPYRIVKCQIKTARQSGETIRIGCTTPKGLFSH